MNHVLAITGLDCAAKLRIRYRLPVAVDREWLARFDDEDDCRQLIHEFSGLVAGAMDHATLACGDYWLAKAVLGQPEVVVTFYRSRRHDTDQVVARFEATAFDGIGEVIHAPTAVTSGS